MAKRIIILERLPGPRLSFSFALWATVPIGRQQFYMKPATTPGPNGTTIQNVMTEYRDAIQTEKDAIAAGQVVEQVETISVEPGTTVAQIQTQLLARWQAFQDEVTAQLTWQRYGTFWDGTAWTNAGIV